MRAERRISSGHNVRNILIGTKQLLGTDPVERGSRRKKLCGGCPGNDIHRADCPRSSPPAPARSSGLLGGCASRGTGYSSGTTFATHRLGQILQEPRAGYDNPLPSHSHSANRNHHRRYQPIRIWYAAA
eukprot:7974363-Pyramimonas_sp.AAC.1